MSDQHSSFKKSDCSEKGQLLNSSNILKLKPESKGTLFWWSSATPKVHTEASTSEIESTDFQSLKLESMEESKIASVNFSKLLENELPMRLSEATASSKDLADAKSAQSTSNDDTEMDHFLSQQTTVFDQLREFLLAQQMCLRQNLEMLHSNTSVPKQEGIHYSSVGRHPDAHSDDTNQNDDLEALRQWGSSSGKTNEIQICPVCGMEFDMNDNSMALEEHVARHWSSSEPL